MSKFSTIVNFSPAVKSACAFVLKKSLSNSAAYHNFYHIMVVAEGCLEASEYYNFSKEDTENILIAALFHDFSHSMGKEKDDVNIKVAIDGLILWADKNKCNYEIIRNIIKATEYPYKIESSELSIRQQIIRDADLRMCLCENYIQQIIFGLGAEMKKTTQEMIDGQIGFLSNIKPATEWFEKEWSERKSGLLEELRLLSETYSL